MRPGCLRNRHRVLKAAQIFAQFFKARRRCFPGKVRSQIGSVLPIAAPRGFPYQRYALERVRELRGHCFEYYWRRYIGRTSP